MVDDNFLKSNVFSLFLSKNGNSEQSKIMFGGVDDKKIFPGSKFKYYNIYGDDYWALPLDKILVGGKDTGVCSGNKCKAILDSGTTLLTSPTHHVQKVFGKISRFLFLCFSPIFTKTLFSLFL